MRSSRPVSAARTTRAGRSRAAGRRWPRGSRAHQQEVEDEPADPDEEHERVDGQVAALDRAGDRRARADDAGRTADQYALDEVGLDDAAPETPDRSRGRDEG